MSDAGTQPIELTLRDAIAWIRFDLPGERVNKLSRAVLEHFAELLSELESRTDVKGAILTSGKDGIFLAGADVSEIRDITDSDRATSAVHSGQAIMDRVARLPFPVIAAIGGVCLGGGTELALACDARVGSDHPRFQIGLPEVNLGLIPAWGGTTRLPRLVGLRAALDVILNGRGLDARRAARIGLVDRAVSHAELERRAVELLHELVLGRRPKRRRFSLGDWLLEGNPLGRALLFSQARKRVLAQTKGHYPAPLAAIDILRRGRRSEKRSFELEAEKLRELLPGTVAKSLVHLFFLNEQAKKDSGVSRKDVETKPVETAGLLGAGTMGGGIARLLASRDISVRLKDVSPEALGAGLRAARDVFEQRRKRRRMTLWELEQKMALITPTLDWSGFGRAQLVIEAIVEDLEIKKSVLRDLEPVVSENCIIATNTSTLSVTDMQGALGHPERMAGFHFFNPVDRMPLIEVVRGAETDDSTVASLVAFAKRLGKTPVVVNDGPGFLVNRILGPYLNEASYLLLETGDVGAIDRVFVDFGMPMGPLRLLDEVGIDVAQKAGKVLAAAFGERTVASGVLDRMVEAGRFGKKSGRGFYRHEGKKSVADPEVVALVGARGGKLVNDEALERAVGLMVAEAARCLDEGIVRSAGELDLAMVMGTGFPPFRGGLLRHADQIGVARVREQLEKLRAAHGERFAVPEALASLSAFYN